MLGLFSRHHTRLAVLILLVILGVAIPAQAQSYYYGGFNNAASYNGYQLGYGAGSNDRAYGASFDIGRHKAYRDGDSGFRNSGFGDKDEYESVFRSAFQIGYRDGYYGAARQGYYYDNNYPTYYYRVPRRHQRDYWYRNRYRDRDRDRDRYWYWRHR
ncbi:MAG: hypothetical protein AB1489_06420 [Acidobacteriota bacterium]